MAWFVRPSAMDASTSRSLSLSSSRAPRPCLRPPHEKRDNDGIEHRSASANSPDRVGKLGEVGDSILEEVADALGAVAQEFEGVAGACVVGEHEYTHIREVRPDLPRGPDAPISLGGHADVDDSDVWFQTGDLVEELGRVRGLAHDVESSLGQQPRHPLPDKDRVVGEHYAHGIAARISVPLPASLTT